MRIPRNSERLDDGLRFARELALHTGVDRVEITVRQNGRVQLSGETGTFVRWRVYADLLPGASEPAAQYPSAVACDAWHENGSKE